MVMAAPEPRAVPLAGRLLIRPFGRRRSGRAGEGNVASIKKVGLWVVGLGAAAAAAVTPFARGEGLAGLDAKLKGTGRIGTYTPHAAIAPAADAGVPATGRDPT